MAEVILFAAALRAIFVAGFLLILLCGMLLAYLHARAKLRARQREQERERQREREEREHEERMELFEDENL